jgi:L-aspartate oxidase
MTRGAGVLRDASGLGATVEQLDALAARDSDKPGTEAWETTNLATVAAALLVAAQRRSETRGCHWREDYPDADDAWLGHLVSRLAPDGIASTYEDKA